MATTVNLRVTHTKKGETLKNISQEVQDFSPVFFFSQYLMYLLTKNKKYTVEKETSTSLVLKVSPLLEEATDENTIEESFNWGIEIPETESNVRS